MPSSEQKRILLVDDSEADLEMIKMVLDEAGYANPIDTAGSGQEALDFLFRNGAFAGRDTAQPSLVILDNKMLGLSGIEVVAEMRKNPATDLIPVVIFSSSKLSRDITDSYTNGANAYVVKPVAFEEFTRVVNNTLQYWIYTNTDSASGM
ncbi:MAG: response regulator [Candidatus Protistobacter heckmanni]|nr:response regulator [Candidatus Protistobacter heckmanni]